MKKIVYISLSIIIFLGIVYSTFFFYNRYKRNANNIENITSNVDNNGNNKDIKMMTLPDKPEVIPEWYKTDKDGDDLTDDEEDRLGTNKFESDSDFDELSDKLEIEKYKTDPMNADTDGDGYRDGEEVLNGYDPLNK